MSTCDPQFWQDRLTRCKEQIVAYEDAIDALVNGGVQSYTLNTGQTVQTVTKVNIASLRSMLSELYNRAATLEARVGGCGVSVQRPGF